jgi:hypothetical protein
MPMQRGPLGGEYSLFDLSRGCSYLTTGHKSQSGIVRIVNWRNAPSASLEAETPVSFFNIQPPTTDGWLKDEKLVLCYEFQRMLSSPVLLAITNKRVLRYFPADNSTRLIYTWPKTITSVCAETWNSCAYLATGVNQLLEIKRNCSASLVSSNWDEGYRQPSVVTAYQSLMIVGGFWDASWTDSSGTFTSTKTGPSEIRATDTDGAKKLLPYSTMIQTMDSEAITALAAAPWGLVIWKTNNQFVLTGTDFQMFTDINIRKQTPGIGCSGPGAWCMDDSGNVYFQGQSGVYQLSNPMDAAIEISLPISPLFKTREGEGPFDYPLVAGNDPTTHMAFDPIRKTVTCSLEGAAP